MLDYPLLPTSLVGSYAQPNWLIDKKRLGERLPPRVILNELWKPDPSDLEEAQNDATLVALNDQRRARVDIVTDGEMRRESYSNRFANALEGVDIDNPGQAMDRTGKQVPVPRVIGEIRRRISVEAPYIEFLKQHTDKPIKITLPGPFTMSQQAEDQYYNDPSALAMDYAAAVNDEIHDLFIAGADMVQIDEPWLQARPEAARDYAIPSINRALEGVEGATALHLCMGYAAMIKDRPDHYHFLEELSQCPVDQISVETAQPNLDLSALIPIADKTIILGVINLDDMTVESEQLVADRIERAFEFLAPENVIPAPDCGFKYLPRDIAFAKLQVLVEGTRLVRQKLG